MREQSVLQLTETWYMILVSKWLLMTPTQPSKYVLPDILYTILVSNQPLNNDFRQSFKIQKHLLL